MWTHHPGWAWWNVTRPVRWATWASLTNWWGWGGYYAEPIYYDYGSSIVCDGETVTIDGEEYASADEYAQQAIDLAATGAETIAAAEQQQAADQIEWMALGVFALTDEEDGDPSMFIQLAVAKDGTVGGSYFNSSTEQTLPVQGAVDRETQRLAFTIGENEQTVLETGIYNLTEDQAPVMVHFGEDRTQTWLMVRIDPPEEEQAAAK